MSDPLNGKKWPLLVAFLASAAVAIWFWGFYHHTLTFH
jgi:hypothetical protein